MSVLPASRAGPAPSYPRDSAVHLHVMTEDNKFLPPAASQEPTRSTSGIVRVILSQVKLGQRANRGNWPRRQPEKWRAPASSNV